MLEPKTGVTNPHPFPTPSRLQYGVLFGIYNPDEIQDSVYPDFTCRTGIRDQALRCVSKYVVILCIRVNSTRQGQ